MKAIVYSQYGPPEVAKLLEVEKPEPKENEILIKVYYTTVNRTDSGFRSAEYFISRFWSGLLKPKLKILGNEFSGEVVGIGAAVKFFKIGDKVFGYNDKTFGAHAEFIVVPETSAVSTLPANLNFEMAAALTEGAHYALADIRAAGITSGQSVLVNGATGAIGSAAVQLIKNIGADVVAVCHGKHLELIKSLGADVVIDYTKEDFTKLNRKFDVVFDAVGKSNFGKCKAILKDNGIYMSTELGPLWENPLRGMFAPWIKGKKIIFPLPTISKQDVEYLKALAETGKFKPLIDRVFDMEQIVEAYTYVETGMKTGNVLLKVAD